MTPEAQRIAIAEACGWTMSQENLAAHGSWLATTGESLPNINFAPNYLTDLNAMHEAEKTLSGEQWVKYVRLLGEATGDQKGRCHATSAQRAEAFLRTLNLWDDSK